MIEDVLQSLKAKKLLFDLFAEEIYSTNFEYRGDEPYSVLSKNTKGVGLRVVNEGRVGFSSSSDFSKSSEIVNTAIALSRYGERVNFSFPEVSEYPKCESFSSAVSVFNSEKLFSLGKDVIGEVKSRFPPLKIDLSIKRILTLRQIFNSSGLEAGGEQLLLFLDFSGLLVLDDGLVWISDFANLSRSGVLDLKEFATKIAEKASWASKKAKLATGDYSVILMPEAAAQLFSIFLVGVNGEHFIKKSTPLLDKEGEKIAPDFLSIYDDGLLPFGFGSFPFDGEGVSRQRSVLLDRGVFLNFLFDLKTAAVTQRKSTGNAKRSYSSPPRPSFSNLVIGPGEGNLAQLIKSLNRGILVFSVIGGGQSNVLAGDFSFGISLGFLIEKGEVVGRIKDCSFAGNFYEFLNQIALVGDTVYDLGPSHLPFVFWEGCKIVVKD